MATKVVLTAGPDVWPILVPLIKSVIKMPNAPTKGVALSVPAPLDTWVMAITIVSEGIVCPMTIVVQARLAKITDVWTRAPALVEAGLSAK